MNEAAKKVLHHLVLEETTDGSFSSVYENEGWQQVFGGQLMAQAVKAATNTVSGDKGLVSFHSTFASTADISQKIIYGVEDIREGNSFSMRRVVASQNKQARFHANISFQVDDDGLDFQARMPDVSPPDQCADLYEVVSTYQKYYPEHLGDVDAVKPLPHQPVEMRFANVDRFLKPTADLIDQAIWIKLDADIGDGQETHKQVLAYASDQSISHVVAQPHGLGGLNPKLRLISLDHAMWFHRAFRADDWLLLVRRCQSTASGRALVTGEFFNSGGALVASLAQQALVRIME